MPRTEPLKGLEELYAALETADVVNLPQAPPPERERDLASLLAFAFHFTSRQKRVIFPESMDWDVPGFTVEDDKVDVPVRWARLTGPDALVGTLHAVAASVADGEPTPLVALDVLDADVAEFQVTHQLYGDPVLLPHRAKPPRSREPRLAHAKAAGWVPTLKEHNLVPGRGLFVPDENLGLLIRDVETRALRGVLLLLPSGLFSLNLNPLARDADPDLQYWLAWGRGGAASEWQDVLMVEDDGVDGPPDADADRVP